MSQAVIDWDGWSEDPHRIDGDRWSSEQIESFAQCLPRVGKASAERIARGLGLDFFDAIETRPEALADVSNLTTTQAWEAWEGWQFLKHIYRLPIVPMDAGVVPIGYIPRKQKQSWPWRKQQVLRENPQVRELFCLIARWLHEDTPAPMSITHNPTFQHADVPGCGKVALYRPCGFRFSAPFLKWPNFTIALTAGAEVRVTVENPHMDRWQPGEVPNIQWESRRIGRAAVERIAQSRRGVRGLRDAK